MRELSQRQAGDAGQGVVVGGDPEGCAGRQELASGQVAQPGAQVIRCGDQDGAELVDGLGAGLVRAAVQCFQRA